MIDKDGNWWEPVDVLREVQLLSNRLDEIFERFPDEGALKTYNEYYTHMEPEEFWQHSASSNICGYWR